MELTQTSNNLLQVLISIASILITWHIAKSNLRTPLKTETNKGQLYNVYLPLFQFIEPHLYHRPSDNILYEFITIFNDIKSQHYALIPCSLIEYFDTLNSRLKNNTYTDSHYEALCAHIDYEFEKRRKYLSLPTRNFSYKYRYGQFTLETRTLINRISNLIGIGLFYFLIFLVIVAIINFLVAFLNQLIFI